MQSLRLENWGLEERSWPELVGHGACTGERLQGWQGGRQLGWMLKLQTARRTARTRATCTLLFKNSASCTTGQTLHRVKIQRTEQRHVMAGGTTNQKDVPFMLGTRDAQCCLFQNWSKRPHCLSARCRVATCWRSVHSFQESLAGGRDDFFRHSCLSYRKIEVVDDLSRGRILCLFGCSRKFNTNGVVRALVQLSRTGIQDTLH